MSVDTTGPFADLDPQAVAHWVAKWNDIGLWDDILLLADRAWTAESRSDRALSWHHLLLAVGNFKRQGNRRIRVPRLVAGPLATIERPSVFTTPNDLTVRVDERIDWEKLADSIPGVATPTCTTLLAALWPDDHFVFDWRVRAVASGLLMKRGLPRCPSIESATPKGQPGPITMEDYAVVRSNLKNARLNLRDAERAMYEVSRVMPSEPDRTWEKYSGMVNDAFSADYLALDWTLPR